MSDRVEEFCYVALQRIASFGIVFTLLTQHGRETCNPIVRSFPYATGKRLVDEQRIKNGIHYLHNRMVQNSVAHRCLMNMTLFRIENMEILISSMFVCAILQITGQRENMRFQIILERYNIKLIAFPFPEFIPCLKKALGIGNFIKNIFNYSHMNDFDIPIVKKAYELYKLLHEYRKVIPKSDRYTIYERCEFAILGILELLLEASY